MSVPEFDSKRIPPDHAALKFESSTGSEKINFGSLPTALNVTPPVEDILVSE